MAAKVASKPEEGTGIREPRNVTGIYTKRAGSTITLKEGDILHVYPADVGLLLSLAKPDANVKVGDTITVKQIDVNGVYTSTSVVNVVPGPDGFKTAKEILQDNIDAMKPKPSEPTPDEVAQKEKEDAEKRIAENERYARELAAERKKSPKRGVEPAQNVPEGNPTKTEDKVPQNVAMPVSPPIVKEDGIAKIVRETHERVAAEKSAQLPAVVAATTAPAPATFNIDQINLIKATVARNCTNTEFELFMYLAAQYHLDPLRKQIWMTKWGENPASIFTGRDGFLEIAHRSGQFDGMESGTKTVKEGDKEEMIGWCRVYRKDMHHPFEVEVYFKEYEQKSKSGKDTLWQTKPRTMIIKVAESHCLRRAFSISGLYSPEEMPESMGGGTS